MLLSAAASAQDVVVQTLDRVAVNSIDSVLEMNFADPMRDTDFVDTGISGSQFRACRLTAIDGVFCLDGEVVRNWRNPDEPSQFTTVLDCRDPMLNLDSRKPDICSGLTVDSTGAIWIAGRNKARTYSLIKTVRKSAGGACPAGFDPLSLSNYCADEVATGRPLLIDINSVDGEVAEGFTYGSGILGLEERKTAVFFPSSGPAIVIASGKQGWGLQGSEQLQSIGLLQVPDSTAGLTNLVLATTSNGRVLAINAAQGGTAFPVFNVPANRASTSVQCDFNAASYGIRASDKSGLVYVTDRQYCEVVALETVLDGSGHFSHLTNAKEPVFNAGGTQTGVRNLTLSTAAGPSATYPPEGPSIAPGIGIDLRDCADECTLVVGEDGNAAATLSDVTLASQASGLTLFQIKNIPDCRYIPDVCEQLLDVNDLVAAGVVVDPAATGNPAAQLLNMTKLLPGEITDLFVDDPLPDMLMSRQYRGQQQNGFTFEAFFGIPEDGVVFRDTFVGEFDVFALAGSELGCELNLPPHSPLFSSSNQTGTLEWDVITTVSETFVTFTGPGPRHVDTIINFDCGSSRSLTGRWSLKPYNLEITPCTFNDDPNDVWASDGSCPVGGPETPDDAVFAKLVLKLYDELGDALDQVACTDADGGGSAPLSASSCSTLDSAWLNGKDKLDKCWEATQQPKQSSGDQNCQAFLSQFSGFSSTLEAATGGGSDPANRRGELRARVETIFHVYHERFVPSIPAAAFQEP